MAAATRHPQILIAAVLAISLCLAPGAAVAARSIDKVNGAIRTEAGTDYDTLETVNGSIHVARGVHARGVETVNGGIELDEQSRVGDASTVNGGISAGRDVIVEGDLETVNGGISTDAGSEVIGKVETVNGGIQLRATRVGAGIETVNGDIEVLDGSTVKGGIIVRKPNTGWFSTQKLRVPRVVIGANSVVEGELLFEREVDLQVDPTAKIGRVTGATVKTLEVERR